MKKISETITNKDPIIMRNYFVYTISTMKIQKKIHTHSLYYFQINERISVKEYNHKRIMVMQEQKQEQITIKLFGVTVKEVFPICLR